MTESNSNNELSKIAREIARSTSAYSEAVASISKHNTCIDAITQQMNFERKLFGSANVILEKIAQSNTISPSIQSIVAANSSFTRIVYVFLLLSRSQQKILLLKNVCRI